MFTDASNTRNRLRFIQIPSKRLKKDTRTQENKGTFIFIADKVFGCPVVGAYGRFDCIKYQSLVSWKSVTGQLN